MAPAGEEVAAVLPLNLFVPGAILPVTDTSFQVPPLNNWKLVKLPATEPDPKFTESDALPSAYPL